MPIGKSILLSLNVLCDSFDAWKHYVVLYARARTYFCCVQVDQLPPLARLYNVSCQTPVRTPFLFYA